MRKSRVALAASVLVGVSVAGFVAATGLAQADTQAQLPIESFGDVVVDGVHKRVFISDQNGKIIAADYSGKVVAERPGLQSVHGLALSGDSSRLYAALPGAHAIVALATDTMSEVARYSAGDEINPRYVTVAGGKVWFGYLQEDGGGLGSVDLSNATVKLGEGLAGTQFLSEPYVYSSAAAPGTLVAADQYAQTLWTYDVSSGTAVETKRDSGNKDEFPVSETAFTADGSQLVRVANGAERQVRLSDLTTTLTYPALARANGVDVGADGRVAISVANQATGDDVYVFKGGETTASQTIRLPEKGAEPVPGLGEPPRDGIQDRGLAWEPGGQRLFAVARYKKAFRLWVLNEPVVATPALTVRTPATAERARPLAISGTSSLPAGTEVVVRRADLESADAVVCTAKTDATGNFACSDTPPAGGAVTYTAAFAGNDQYSAASAKTTVTVSRATPALAVDRNGAVFAYGSTATFTARLGATHANRTVEIWADPAGPEANRLVKKATVNGAGNVTASFRLTRNTTVTAKFTGDPRFAPRSATSTVYTKVAVGTAVSGHYQTGRIGSTTYHYFDRKVTPQFTTTMTAYPGRRQRITVEYYAAGTWHSRTSSYVAVSSSGKSYANLVGSRPLNGRFRVSAAYLMGGSGDQANYTTYGAWVYFTFKK